MTVNKLLRDHARIVKSRKDAGAELTREELLTLVVVKQADTIDDLLNRAAYLEKRCRDLEDRTALGGV